MEPQDAEARVRQELGPDEQLLWYGRPGQGILFRPADRFCLLLDLIAFGFGFALLWRFSADSADDPAFFLFPFVFALLGLYRLLGRFLVDAAERKRVIYALTSERLLIIYSVFQSGVKSVRLKTLGEMTVTERIDGTGTIIFGRPPRVYPRYVEPPTPAFDDIANVRDVYEQLRQARKAAH